MIRKEKKLGNEGQEGGSKCILNVIMEKEKKKLVDEGEKVKLLKRTCSLARGRKLKYHG